jgi:hypothetical protein
MRWLGDQDAEPQVEPFAGPGVEHKAPDEGGTEGSGCQPTDDAEDGRKARASISSASEGKGWSHSPASIGLPPRRIHSVGDDDGFCRQRSSGDDRLFGVIKVA